MNVKKENFHRICVNRVSKILSILEQLTNLTNFSYYEYSNQEVEELLGSVISCAEKTKDILIKANDKKNRKVNL